MLTYNTSIQTINLLIFLNMNDYTKDQIIDDYLNSKLSRENLIAFEKQLFTDHALAEEVKISKNLFALHGTESWCDINVLNEDGIAYQEYLLSDDAKKIKSAISNASKKYNRKSITPTKRYRWYSIAASLVLLIAFSYTFTSNQNTPENLYADYSNLSELPSLTQRSDADKLLSEAEKLFLNEEYIGAVRSLELYNEKYNSQSANTLLYKGMCYLELKQYSKAEQIFNSLQNSDTLDKNKAYWYLALTSLKQEDITSTKKTLQLIIANSYYNHQKAKQLLAKLN